MTIQETKVFWKLCGNEVEAAKGSDPLGLQSTGWLIEALTNNFGSCEIHLPIKHLYPSREDYKIKATLITGNEGIFYNPNLNQALIDAIRWATKGKQNDL